MLSPEHVSVISRVVLLIGGTLLLLTITYRTFLHQDDDPYRCRAVKDTGYWADPVSQVNNLTSHTPFKDWRVKGCIFHEYESEEIRQCMQGRYALTSGDSTTRQVAFGLARLLDERAAIRTRQHMSKHDPINMTYHGVEIQQHWNPFLEQFGRPTHIRKKQEKKFIKQLEFIQEDKELPRGEEHGASLAMFGVGAWFSNADIPIKDSLKRYDAALSNVSDIIGSKRDFITEPMDPFEGVGDQVFFAPPAGPHYNGHDPSKKASKLVASGNVNRFQNFLAEKEKEDYFNFHMLFAIPEMVKDNTTWVDPKITGFHVVNSVAEAKANILLNLRCNAKMDRIMGYPYNRTCCTDYGVKPIAQLALVAAACVYLAACVVGEIMDLATRRDKPRFGWLNMESGGAFTMALLLCYFADRTHLFAKGEKTWSYFDFFLFCAPALVLAIVSIRKSASPRPSADANGVALEVNQPFISRDQAEEWKGWMQVLILVYHWTAAKDSTAIYIIIRLLVAAYLFQTGYGHTTYFIKKKDFSFKRLASVLLRLNLLPCALAYIMGTDYMNYYFSPLCSFWFIIVYLTLAVFPKWNDDTQLLLAKICVSAVFVWLSILATPLNKLVFIVLRLLFNIQWDIDEWEYRVALDIFIVYVGMLTAVAYTRMEQTVRPALTRAMALLGVAIIGGFSYASQSVLKTEYRSWHPYASIAPVLAYIAIRNVSNPVRNYYSSAMAWLGRCSLETYTLQFHIFLAADTHGVLLIDALNKSTADTILDDRWKSLLVVVPVFLWISSATATATANLIKLILSTPEPKAQQIPTEDNEKDEEAAVAGDEYDPDYDDSSAGLLGRPGSAVKKYMKYVPTMSSVIYSIQVRLLLLLLVMWLLNLCYPIPDRSIPDGYTEYQNR